MTVPAQDHATRISSHRHTSFRVYIATGSMLVALTVHAEEPDIDARAGQPAEVRESEVFAYAGRVLPPMTAPTAPITRPAADAEKRKWDRALPFFAQRVIDQGYDLPNPYDIGVSLFSGDQEYHLSDLKIGFNGASPQTLDFVNFTRTEIHTRSYQVQGGAWIFPFLNVYGILGQVHGEGDIDISIPGRDLMNYLGVSGCNLPARLQPDLCSKTLSGTAKPNYRGNSYGVGMTVAGAWHQIFFALPITYVLTDASISDSPARALNIAPRVGWSQPLKDLGSVVYYVGGTYLRSTSNLTGEFTFNTADTVIGRDTTMSFDITEKQVQSWNYLVGANWNISKSWGIAGEIGFGNTRNDVIITGFYRF
ncbi:hypothetical protein ACDA63_00170 [Uliginosibacterium sp. sgz301328]|uniref:hypothetical protein n=1 Tax=Uliginosibacterium sp. sgz301328 TaxID=3243764 RepID=UPI00359D5EFA